MILFKSRLGAKKILTLLPCVEDDLFVKKPGGGGGSPSFTCHVMHRALALSNKMYNDTADTQALLGFNDLESSVSLLFFSETDFIQLQLPPHCPKRNKKINVGS